MRGRALLVALLLPAMARADALAFQLWPTRYADDMLSCRIELRGGQIVAIEYRGSGPPPPMVMRWPVRQGEELAVLHALQALVSGDLPGVEPYTSRNPPPPYVALVWSTRVDGRLTTGLYLQQGLSLPPVLAGLIETVLPGGPCWSEISGPGAAPG